jgi:hypothetical protein
MDNCDNFLKHIYTVFKYFENWKHCMCTKSALEEFGGHVATYSMGNHNA